MNARFKQFGASLGSKRNSNRQQPHTTSSQNSVLPASTTGDAPTTPPLTTASPTRLPMNQGQQNGLGRPPSYTYNPHAPRSSSPLPPAGQQLPHHPPPINTGSYPQGHPALNGAAQPPGYAGGYAQPNGMHGAGAPQSTMGHYPGRGAPVEVEGAGRSKAQLIVGIDFVRTIVACTVCSRLTCRSGNHLFWSCFCFRDQYRSKGGYHYRMARRWQSNQTKSRPFPKLGRSIADCPRFLLFFITTNTKKWLDGVLTLQKLLRQLATPSRAYRKSNGSNSSLCFPETHTLTLSTFHRYHRGSQRSMLLQTISSNYGKL